MADNDVGDIAIAKGDPTDRREEGSGHPRPAEGFAGRPPDGRGLLLLFCLNSNVCVCLYGGAARKA